MNENRIKVYKLQNMGKSIIFKKKKKKQAQGPEEEMKVVLLE